MHTGVCVGWEGTYGFLRIDGLEKRRVFVHYEDLAIDWPFKELYEGERVLVGAIEETSRSPAAKGVQLAGLTEYEEATEVLEAVLADAKPKLKKQQEWAVLEELAQAVLHARQEHYDRFMALHEKRRETNLLRIPYSNLRDDSQEVLASCEGTRKGHITLVHAVKVVSGVLKTTERGKSNAQALKVRYKRLLKLRDAGVMVYEVDNALEAIRAECERQLAKGRNRNETRRLRYLAEDIANDLGLTEE